MLHVLYGLRLVATGTAATGLPLEVLHKSSINDMSRMRDATCMRSRALPKCKEDRLSGSPSHTHKSLRTTVLYHKVHLRDGSGRTRDRPISALHTSLPERVPSHHTTPSLPLPRANHVRSSPNSCRISASTSQAVQRGHDDARL